VADGPAIGIDAGGTKVLGLLVDADGGILDRLQLGTPANDAEASAADVIEVATKLATAHADAVAIGVGAAGLVDRKGRLRFAPNVAWRELSLHDRVADAVGVPVLVDNDATAAAWGEFRFGAARGFDDVLLLTIGTGIGGGVVSGGRLYRGAHGFAGEMGHFIVEPGGPQCGCGNMGCLESVASGRAIDRLGRAAAVEHPTSELARLAGGDPGRAVGPVVTRAAKAGDPIATRVLAEVGRRLGEGIAGLVNVLDPAVVVVGGGAIDAGDLLLEPARAAYRSSVEGGGHRPDVPIVAAELGNDAGAVGAADLARLEAAG
jgi:glucokinase